MMVKDIYKKHPKIGVGTLLGIDGETYVIVIDSMYGESTRVKCVNINTGEHFGSTLVMDVNDISESEARSILIWDCKYNSAKVVGGLY